MTAKPSIGKCTRANRCRADSSRIRKQSATGNHDLLLGTRNTTSALPRPENPEDECEPFTLILFTPARASHQRARYRFLFRAQSRQSETVKQRYRIAVQRAGNDFRSVGAGVAPQRSQLRPPRTILRDSG